MRHLLALAPLLLLACAAPAEDEAASSEGAATAQARAQLEDFTGTWTIQTDASEVKAFPAKVTIAVSDDSVDPTTKETIGTRLRIMRVDAPTVPAVDRAPFVNVDEGKGCESVYMGGVERVSVCHTTTLSHGGKTLTHSVTLTSYQAFVFPTGWSTATQVLAIEGDKLHYTYTIDGTPSGDVILAR